LMDRFLVSRERQMRATLVMAGKKECHLLLGMQSDVFHRRIFNVAASFDRITFARQIFCRRTTGSELSR
jgi:hypothetical protein